MISCQYSEHEYEKLQMIYNDCLLMLIEDAKNFTGQESQDMIDRALFEQVQMIEHEESLRVLRIVRGDYERRVLKSIDCFATVRGFKRYRPRSFGKCRVKRTSRPYSMRIHRRKHSSNE